MIKSMHDFQYFSAEEEDGDKDFDEDENDDGEVEEIIQQSIDGTDEINNDDIGARYSERRYP